jgi:hypothetical protein
MYTKFNDDLSDDKGKELENKDSEKQDTKE